LFRKYTILKSESKIFPEPMAYARFRTAMKIPFGMHGSFSLHKTASRPPRRVHGNNNYIQSTISQAMVQEKQLEQSWSIKKVEHKIFNMAQHDLHGTPDTFPPTIYLIETKYLGYVLDSR
jgi:hypothetical protein